MFSKWFDWTRRSMESINACLVCGISIWLNQQIHTAHTHFYLNHLCTHSTQHPCVRTEHRQQINYILIKYMHTPTHPQIRVKTIVLLMIEQCSEMLAVRWVDSNVNSQSGHFRKGCDFINTVAKSSSAVNTVKISTVFSSSSHAKIGF